MEKIDIGELDEPIDEMTVLRARPNEVKLANKVNEIIDWIESKKDQLI